MSEANGHSVVEDDVFRIIESGVVTFDIRGTLFPVDLYLFVNEYNELNEESGNFQRLIRREHIDLVKRWGGPPDCSGKEAAAVIDECCRRVNAEKKSTEEPAASPGSTASTACA